MFHAWHIIRGQPPAFTGFTVAVICGDVGAYRGHPPKAGDGASRPRRKALRGGVCELKFLL